jgi:hypothetical protein
MNIDGWEDLSRTLLAKVSHSETPSKRSRFSRAARRKGLLTNKPLAGHTRTKGALVCKGKITCKACTLPDRFRDGPCDESRLPSWGQPRRLTPRAEKKYLECGPTQRILRAPQILGLADEPIRDHSPLGPERVGLVGRKR